MRSAGTLRDWPLFPAQRISMPRLTLLTLGTVAALLLATPAGAAVTPKTLPAVAKTLDGQAARRVHVDDLPRAADRLPRRAPARQRRLGPRRARRRGPHARALARVRRPRGRAGAGCAAGQRMTARGCRRAPAPGAARARRSACRPSRCRSCARRRCSCCACSGSDEAARRARGAPASTSPTRAAPAGPTSSSPAPTQLAQLVASGLRFSARDRRPREVLRERARRRPPLRRTRVGAAGSPLPTGRTTYRTYDEIQAELKGLVDAATPGSCARSSSGPPTRAARSPASRSPATSTPPTGGPSSSSMARAPRARVAVDGGRDGVRPACSSRSRATTRDRGPARATSAS